MYYTYYEGHFKDLWITDKWAPGLIRECLRFNPSTWFKRSTCPNLELPRAWSSDFSLWSGRKLSRRYPGIVLAVGPLTNSVPKSTNRIGNHSKCLSFTKSNISLATWMLYVFTSYSFITLAPSSKCDTQQSISILGERSKLRNTFLRPSDPAQHPTRLWGDKGTIATLECSGHNLTNN